MKKIITILLVLLCNFCYAQNTQTMCGIWYDYDAAGNRVKRYYDCKEISNVDGGGTYGSKGTNQDQTNNQVTNSNKDVIVFPNPVKDYFTIRLTDIKSRTHFHLYDSKGSIVFSGNVEGNSSTYDIHFLAAGIYHLSILYGSDKYYFELLKIE